MANANASSRSVGSGSLKNSSRSVPAPGLADLRHRLGEHLAADVGVDAPHREAQRAGPAAGRACRLSDRLERLGADRGEAVVEGAGQEPQGGRPALRRGLADLGDQHLEAAAADVLVRGVQARLGGQQRVGLVDAGQGGEGGVADLGLLVVEQRAEPLDRRGGRPARPARGRPRRGRPCPPRGSAGAAGRRPGGRPARPGPGAPRRQVSRARLAVAWSSGSRSASSQRPPRRRGAAFGLWLPPSSPSAAGRRLLGGGGAFQLGELALQLRVARRRASSSRSRVWSERRNAVRRTSGSASSARRRRADCTAGSPSSPRAEEADERRRRTSACFDPSATRFASGDCRVVGRFQGDQGRLADLGRLGVERRPSAGRAPGRRASPGPRAPARPACRRRPSRPSAPGRAAGGRTRPGARRRPWKAGHAHRLVGVVEPALRAASRRAGAWPSPSSSGRQQPQGVVGVGADLLGDQLERRGRRRSRPGPSSAASRRAGSSCDSSCRARA